MTAAYEERARMYAGQRDGELRRSALIARLRLLTFLPGAAVVVWVLARGGPPALLLPGVVLLGVFAALVVWHARVDERAAWFGALHAVNMHALARIARDWDGLPVPETPEGASGPWGTGGGHQGHPYAYDLDLFGRASLMQWLGPAATPAGQRTIAGWLLRAAPPEEVTERQRAVGALSASVEWREHFGAHGRLAADVRPAQLERFVGWAESAGPWPPNRARALRAAAVGLTAAIWLPIVLHATGVTAGAYWLLPLTAGVILSFATARAVHAEFDRAGAGQGVFARYAGLFGHAAAVPAGAPRLDGIRTRLEGAPRGMTRLNGVIGFAQLRSSAGILHFVIQALTLWDLHVFFALDRWRRHVGPEVRGWMAALGELDALSAFAQAARDNPAWCTPDVTRETDRLEGQNLGHPLIPDGRRVGNDVQVGPPGTLLLITGSNMSGKSTLLRAIGLNTVLAQAGAPACAASMRLPPLDLETSIRVQDSLEQGLSYFMAALARLKALVDRADGRSDDARPVLYLLDEILQGTNTAERAIAVRGIARHLLAAGAIGVMTTHDLGIAAEEPLATAARLAHFSEQVHEDGTMSFDYRLRPGLATSRNALRLMRLIGIELER